MHCPCCTQELDAGARRCSRCGADLTPQARRHRLTVTDFIEQLFNIRI